VGSGLPRADWLVLACPLSERTRHLVDAVALAPLPAASPLWALPNVIVTPHTAGHSNGNETRVAAIFLDNLRRWTQGQPLLNRV